MGQELFTIVKGKKVDAELQNEILEATDAASNLRQLAVERAISKGMPPALAEKLYNP